MLRLPYWVTRSANEKEGLFLFNWRNNKSVVVFDKDHPAFELGVRDEICDSEIIRAVKEQKEDLAWLEENDFLISESSQPNTTACTVSEKGERLHLILLPAGEACNLNCLYCYEDHSDKRRMNRDTAKAISALVEKREFKFVDVEYFGGEPLLNLQFIEDLYNAFNGNKVSFRASITTNGTLLTEEVLDRLYGAGVRSFQITIDGPKQIHNKLRASKSNALDSFDACCRAIRTIAKSKFCDINVVLRMNLNHESIMEENLGGLISVIKDIVPTEDPRFFMFPKPIGDYLGANLKSNTIATEIYCKQGSVHEVIETIEKRLADEGYALADALILTKRGGYSCYAGKKDSLVITPDLRLRKCTVALDDPINLVGSISPSGDILFNSNIDLWTKDYSDNACSTCFAQNTCQGNSCPLINIKQDSKQCPPIKSKKELITEKVVKFYERISGE